MSPDLAFLLGNCTGIVLTFILFMRALREGSAWSEETEHDAKTKMINERGY